MLRCGRCVKLYIISFKYYYPSAKIIPGSVKNSDLTMPKSTFKNRLADYLLELQSKGDHNIWCQSNIFRS